MQGQPEFELLEQGFLTLSTGERRRLMLARVLIQGPPLLVLDEPFDGLDKATIERISHSVQHDYKPDILILVSHVGSRLGDNARVIEL